MAGLVNEYGAVLGQSRPLIDVRAPGEFARGAFPNAVNLPLLSDNERAMVGTTYKRAGQEAAIELGQQVVSGGVRRARMAAWCAFGRQHPDALIYCARGGQRSLIVQAWLADADVHLGRIAGGFKALRRFCLATLDCIGERQLLVVGGRTGSGKTAVVRAAMAHVDLEALANHRGSAFGRMTTPQPPPIAFENALATAILRLPVDAPIVVEDESRTIGRLAIPEPMFKAMSAAPLLLLEVDDEQRIANIHREYVLEAGNPGHHLLGALAKIERRLGGVRYRAIKALMEKAFSLSPKAAWPTHRRWILRLLKDYYDPMYDYQLQSKQDRVVLRGTPVEVVAALKRLGPPWACSE